MSILGRGTLMRVGAAVLALGAGPALGATIAGWNKDNVETDQPPFTPGETFNSTVYTDSNQTTSHGAVIWTEGSVVAPGAQVLTDSPPDTDRNCIITTGTNRADPTSPPKTCSDEFQSAKRVKTEARVPNTAIDLVFDVTADADPKTYRVFQKYINAIARRMDGFIIELGFGTGDPGDSTTPFTPSTADDGLAFTDRAGNAVPSESDPPGDSNLGSLMSAGLFGDADSNQNITRDGYFFDPDFDDPSGTGRSYYNLQASEDVIETVGNVQGLHFELFGNMLGQDQLPFGYFYDEDGDPDTDATTVGNWNGSEWETYVLIDPITGVVQLDSDGNYLRPENPPVPVPDDVVARWCNQQDTGDGITPFYFVAVLDDMGLTNNNYHITVSDISDIASWPTYDAPTGSATFTLRITNIGEDAVFDPPWLATLPPEVLDEPCPAVPPVPTAEVDVAIRELEVDRRVKVNRTEEIEVSIVNLGADSATGSVTVIGTKHRTSKTVAVFSARFHLAPDARKEIEFDWTAPRKPTKVNWVATATAAGDTDLGNNTASATTRVIKRKDRDEEDKHDKDDKDDKEDNRKKERDKD